MGANAAADAGNVAGNGSDVTPHSDARRRTDLNKVVKDLLGCGLGKFAGELIRNAEGHPSFRGMAAEDFLALFKLLTQEYMDSGKLKDETRLKVLVLFLISDAMTWYNALGAEYKTSWAKFEAKFEEDWIPKVECGERRVRAMLKTAEWYHQKGEEVRTYNSRFNRMMLLTKDMAQLDRIEWYLTGLATNMRKACMVDAQNQPWSELKHVMTHALGQELRFQLQDQARNYEQRRNKPAIAAAAPFQTAETRSLELKAANKRPRSNGAAPSGSGPGSGSHAQGGPRPRYEQAYRSKEWIARCKADGRCLRCGAFEHKVIGCTMDKMAQQPESFPERN